MAEAVTSTAAAGTPATSATGDGSAASTASTASVRPEPADAELLHRWFQIYSGMQNVTATLLAEVERTERLTAPEFQTLWHLHAREHGRAPMNEISRLLNFSTAGTTKLIDRLCTMSLVERRTSPADRRVILAELTPAGEQAAAQAATTLAAVLRERFVGPLGEARVDAVADAFAVFAAESPGNC